MLDQYLMPDIISWISDNPLLVLAIFAIIGTWRGPAWL